MKAVDSGASGAGVTLRPGPARAGVLVRPSPAARGFVHFPAVPGRFRFVVLAARASVGLGAGGVVGGQAGGPESGRAAETWHWVQKLQTTGSVLQITAHPDDEDGGLLALLGRGHGARTSLLSLTRGEAGANALGPELFDALGVIRAAELEVAGRWYGLDSIYFTPLADYGYSKSLEEARRSWDEAAAVADVVEVIRRERPLVVHARFDGTPADGHGQHRFAGRVAVRAFEAAGDLAAFPPREGRRGYLPGALFVSVRGGSGSGGGESGGGEVALDLSGSRPWLSRSFAELGAVGLSVQRSQTRGVVREAGPGGRRRVARLRRVDDGAGGLAGGVGGVEGLPADLLGLLAPENASLSARFGAVVPARLGEALRELDEAFAGIARDFDWTAPEASLPALGAALAGARALLGERSPSGFFDVRRELTVKERQLEAAVRAAAGARISATARPVGVGDEGAGGEPVGAFGAPVALGPVVPGQEVEVAVCASALAPARVEAVLVEGPGEVVEIAPEDAGGAGGSACAGFRVAVAADAAPFAYPVRRDSIGENRYRTVGDWSRGAPPPAFTATARLAIPRAGGGEVEAPLVAAVERFESNLPYGYERRTLEVLPPVSVRFEPDFAALPAGGGEAEFAAALTATGRAAGEYRVALAAPEGFRAEPESRVVRFDRAGETARVEFRVSAGGLAAGGGEAAPVIRATVAPVGESVGADGAGAPALGYARIAHRDLPLGYDIRPAALRVAVADLAPLPEGLRVGFVSGAGDRVAEAVRALGAEVVPLDDEDLASAPLDGFDAVVLGTRAYAFRPALHAANRRLLDYARGGGHLVVLYNTGELVPAEHAPYPGTLPRRSEEVSEEDGAVVILAPEHPLLAWPNRIGEGDFAGWVEQRGSKFWSEWDAAYTPLFEASDAGQPPQRGGALTAETGSGRYTYFAYALHRQLPEAVPGAFRLLANLVAARRYPGPGPGPGTEGGR